MEKILVVNAGSSSLKFQLIDMPWDENVEKPVVLFEGGFERIGIENPSVTYKWDGNKETLELDIESHADAVDVLKKLLIEKNIVESLNEITGVGHRYVNGGPEFVKTTVLTDEVLAKLENTLDFAPVHNLLISKVLMVSKLLYQKFYKLSFLILHSIKLCQMKLIDIQYHNIGSMIIK